MILTFSFAYVITILINQGNFSQRLGKSEYKVRKYHIQLHVCVLTEDVFGIIEEKFLVGQLLLPKQNGLLMFGVVLLEIK